MRNVDVWDYDLQTRIYMIRDSGYNKVYVLYVFGLVGFFPLPYVEQKSLKYLQE